MKKISLGILVYNHEKFIIQCLKSVFCLDYSNLEIVISDDASTDNSCQIIEAFIKENTTKHHVVFNQNTINMGLAANFNKAFGELATGDFLVTLGGDDAIKEDYLGTAISYFMNDSQLMMLDFNADIMDEHGHITSASTSLGYDIMYCDLDNYLALDSIPSFAPGRMLRKNLIKQFEKIQRNCPTEDSVLVLRALLLGKFARLNKDVILYRKHANNISGHSNLQMLSNANIIGQYLKDVAYLNHQDGLKGRDVGQLFDRINFEYHRRQYLYAQKKTFWHGIKFNLRKYLYRNSLLNEAE